MDSPTITMERQVALAKLDEYEQAAQRNPKQLQELDREIMQGYRLLARGSRLVDVNEALRHGGLNLAGLPRLAIARADAARTQWSYGRSSGGESVFWWHRHGVWSTRHQTLDFQWRVPAGIFDADKCSNRDAEALTPLVPLPHRPKHDPSNYFLLWEAKWFPAPPRDPYLLRPITGSLMEIIAEWEVSPIELAAVRNAMRSGPK